MLSTTSRHRQQKHRQLSLLLVLLHLLRATSPKKLFRGQAGRDRAAAAAHKGEQIREKDLKNHPGGVARWRFLVVLVVKGQVQAGASRIRLRRRDRRLWWGGGGRWLFCCWPARGGEEGMNEKGLGARERKLGALTRVSSFVFFVVDAAAAASEKGEKRERRKHRESLCAFVDDSSSSKRAGSFESLELRHFCN